MKIKKTLTKVILTSLLFLNLNIYSQEKIPQINIKLDKKVSEYNLEIPSQRVEYIKYKLKKENDNDSLGVWYYKIENKEILKYNWDTKGDKKVDTKAHYEWTYFPEKRIIQTIFETKKQKKWSINFSEATYKGNKLINKISAWDYDGDFKIDRIEYYSNNKTEIDIGANGFIDYTY